MGSTENAVSPLYFFTLCAAYSQFKDLFKLDCTHGDGKFSALPLRKQVQKGAERYGRKKIDAHTIT